MTTSEAKEALEQAALAIVPIGSCEQHGPHLPLNTDAAVADALARRVAAHLGGDAVLCPLIGYGLSEHHLGFPGTLTLRPETLLAMLADLCESLQHNGIDRVLVVNGHGGNIDALRLAGRSARRDRGMMVASVMWAILVGDIVGEQAEADSFGHACEAETSVAMALFPEQVRHELITDGAERSSVDEYTDPPGATVDEAVWLHEWSADGALGRPAAATRSAGEAIVSAFVERTVAYARRMIDRPLPGDDQ